LSLKLSLEAKQFSFHEIDFIYEEDKQNKMKEVTTLTTVLPSELKNMQEIEIPSLQELPVK
jgi:hypothetical protein